MILSQHTTASGQRVLTQLPELLVLAQAQEYEREDVRDVEGEFVVRPEPGPTCLVGGPT
jgi:hypothetical protein